MTEGKETRPQAPSHARHTQFRTFRQILCKFNKDITERERGRGSKVGHTSIKHKAQIN